MPLRLTPDPCIFQDRHHNAPHSPFSKFSTSGVHAAHLFDRACTQITQHCCCKFSTNREISPRDSYRNVSAASGRQAGAVGGVRIHVGVLGEVGERGGFPRDARGLCRLARHRLDQVHVMAGLQLFCGGLSAGDWPAAVCTRMHTARQCLEGCIFAYSLTMTCPSASFGFKNRGSQSRVSPVRKQDTVVVSVDQSHWLHRQQELGEPDPDCFTAVRCCGCCFTLIRDSMRSFAIAARGYSVEPAGFFRAEHTAHIPARPLACSRAMTARMRSGRSGCGEDDCSACMVMRSSKANPVMPAGTRTGSSPGRGELLNSASSFTASCPQSCTYNFSFSEG